VIRLDCSSRFDETGQIDKALAAVEAKEECDSKFAQKLVVKLQSFQQRFELYLMGGLHDQADAYIEEVGIFEPGMKDRFGGLYKIFAAQLLIDLEDDTKGFGDLKSRVEEFGKGFAEQMEIIEFYLAGEYDKCNELLEHDNGKMARQFDNKQFVADIYNRVGKKDQAIALMQKELDKKTSSMYFYYELAALVAEDDPARAQKNLDIALKYWEKADDNFIPKQRALALQERLAAL